MRTVHRKTINAFAFLSFGAMWSSGFSDEQIKRYVYLERTGGENDTCVSTVIKNERGTELTVQYKEESYRMAVDTSLSASSCEVVDKATGKSTLFRRVDGTITCVTQSRSDTYQAENIPWLQTPFSLARFAVSNESDIMFYTATLYDTKEKSGAPGGSMIKLIARKVKKDAASGGKDDSAAVKVVITLPGLKSLFWKIAYWYRGSDGAVIRYEDVRGGPGTPKTIGTLIEEK
jgi:hypothetical protein